MGREALSEVQPPKRTMLGSEWSTSCRSPKEGDEAQEGDAFLEDSLSKGFPGGKQIRERVGSSPQCLGPQYHSATQNWFTGAGTRQ